MITLYQGWYPTPKSVQEIILDQIAYFQRDERKLLDLMDAHENSGHYAECPEDRDIEISNLAFIHRMIDSLEERYGDLVKEGTPRPAQLRVERAEAVVVCECEKVTPC